MRWAGWHMEGQQPAAAVCSLQPLLKAGQGLCTGPVVKTASWTRCSPVFILVVVAAFLAD